MTWNHHYYHVIRLWWNDCCCYCHYTRIPCPLSGTSKCELWWWVHTLSFFLSPRIATFSLHFPPFQEGLTEASHNLPVEWVAGPWSPSWSCSFTVFLGYRSTCWPLFHTHTYTHRGLWWLQPRAPCKAAFQSWWEGRRKGGSISPQVHCEHLDSWGSDLTSLNPHTSLRTRTIKNEE